MLISLTSEKTSQRQTSSNTRSLQNYTKTNVSNGHNIILIKEKDQIIFDQKTTPQTDLSMNSPRIKSSLPTNKHTEINGEQNRQHYSQTRGNPDSQNWEPTTPRLVETQTRGNPLLPDSWKPRLGPLLPDSQLPNNSMFSCLIIQP